MIGLSLLLFLTALMMDSANSVVVTDHNNVTQYNCTVDVKNALNGVERTFNLQASNAAMTACQDGMLRAIAL